MTDNHDVRVTVGNGFIDHGYIPPCSFVERFVVPSCGRVREVSLDFTRKSCLN